MRLILGGYAQGKLSFAIAGMDTKRVLVFDENNYKELPVNTSSEPVRSGITEGCRYLKAEPSPAGNEEIMVILNHFHLIVRDVMREENMKNPDAPVNDRKDSDPPMSDLNGLNARMDQLLAQFPDMTIISDEIGSGIVPMDAFERAWREETGRELIRLAAKAESVVRVVAGIGQRIK